MSVLAAAVVALARGGSTVGPPLVQEALGEVAGAIWPGNHIAKLQFLPLVFPEGGAALRDCATCAGDGDSRMLVDVEFSHADSAAMSNSMYVFSAGATQLETGMLFDGSQFSFDDGDSASACSCTETDCGTASIGGVAPDGRTITGFKCCAFRYAAIWLDDTSPLESMVTAEMAGFIGKRVESLPCEMTLKGHKRMDGLCRNDGPTISVVELDDALTLIHEFHYGAALSVPIPGCTGSGNVHVAAGLIFKVPNPKGVLADMWG